MRIEPLFLSILTYFKVVGEKRGTLMMTLLKLILVAWNLRKEGGFGLVVSPGVAVLVSKQAQQWRWA